jgi:nucleoside-diphosphate-sugar epimerase
MDKQRVLITGAAGFLGSHLCDRFIHEGYDVVGMDNLVTGDLRNIEHLFKLKEFERFVGFVDFCQVLRAVVANEKEQESKKIKCT